LFARPLEAEACTQALVEDRRLHQPEVKRALGVPALLLVDDNEEELAQLERALASDDFHIMTANGATAAFEMLARHGADVVVSNYQMQEMSGVAFLSNVRKLYPEAVRIVATGGDDTPTLTGAINNAGIHKFLSRHWDAERLRAEVRAAYGQRR
jgi:response regulator RpfG family c-di-GMP phosphodiesterase